MPSSRMSRPDQTLLSQNWTMNSSLQQGCNPVGSGWSNFTHHTSGWPGQNSANLFGADVRLGLFTRVAVFFPPGGRFGEFSDVLPVLGRSSLASTGADTVSRRVVGIGVLALYKPDCMLDFAGSWVRVPWWGYRS